jgi:ERCC4-type nuclease
LIILTVLVVMQVDSGMHVLRTRSLDHTITCLRNLHK